MNIFTPKANLTEQEISQGMRWMTWEGVASIGFASISTSGFLAAYALALGADNFQIGVLAALPFLMQLLQIPTIFLIEKTSRRKSISLISWLLAQLLWFPIALIPLFLDVPSAGAVSILLGIVLVRGALSALSNCSWNSWVRDLVPGSILGRFYSKRLGYSAVAAALFGLAAAFFVDYWNGRIDPSQPALGYTIAILFGALFLGMLSPVIMARIPEPLFKLPEGKRPSLIKNLAAPFKDLSFRHLMQFLFFWGIALNMATPFFAVYMLSNLQMSLTSGIALSVLGQVFNIIFLKVWGPLADRFGSKIVLSLCSSLYLLVILGWTFTTMPDRYFLTVPLLILLHIFAGIATAGVSLTTVTLGMKLAPDGQHTAYLTGSSLANYLGSGIGPILGGLLGKFFADNVLTVDLTWIRPLQTIHLGIIDLTGFDFLFVVAFLLGVLTLNMLTGVKESGEAKKEVVLEELLSHTRTSGAGMLISPLVTLTNSFPLVYLHKVPGFDVAIGVTAYQLAETTRKISENALKGRDFSLKLMKSLEKGLSRMWHEQTKHPDDAVSFTEEATVGVMQAAIASPKDTAELIQPAIAGIVKAMSQTPAAPEDIIRGVSQGIVKAAEASNEDLAASVIKTVETLKEAAPQIGMDEKTAGVIAAETALSTANTLDETAKNQIREALPTK
jgi:MFS family permease